MNQCEDEWQEVQLRFKKEGLDFNAMKPDDRLIHIWRWLVDAEINLKNSRRICEKLREQQNEELEEMENYMGKVRELSEKRTINMENESTRLNEQLEAISSILSGVVLQGETVVEKITNLVSDYSRLTEEVQVLNKLKLNNPQNEDLISEMISISTEKEMLKREVIELSERMQLLQKSSRELALDNEKLAFKLSEAFAELEEKEVRLANRKKMLFFIYTKIPKNGCNLNDFYQREFTTIYSGEHSVFNSMTCSKHCESNKSTLSRLEIENMNQVDKCSSEKKDYRDSDSPSLILNDMTDYKATSKLSSLMSSCHEIARLEENKKLQSECESMKTRIESLGEKYNNLALKYIQLKSKRKFQIEELRGRLDASQCQIQTLQVQLSVQRQRLRAEEIFRKQIEADLRKIQDEKRNIIVRLMNSEMEQKETNREIVILQKKIAMLDSANSDLLAKLLQLKYKEPSASKISCDNILPIGSV
ncbi:uncharacterized protein LOC135842515 isoform X1 [Planococcus citri]|uniref:uncharacterized protein LOC135842515 isoform X1 n=1 Tax=Planococcus citri TaxID=170843 RepID=UPI0031F72EAF